MMTLLNRRLLGFQAAFFAGLLSRGEAFAGASSFSDIARNINNSIEELPGLITGLSYMIGLLMGVLGILKIKDHVENPTQTPLKEGAVRLATGGALFGLPIVFEAMLNTIGTTGTLVESAEISKVIFNVK